MNDADHDDAQLHEARARMTRLAVGLTARFGPAQTAFLLAGAAAAILESAYDRPAASRYPAELATAIADPHGPEGGPVGHA